MAESIRATQAQLDRETSIRTRRSDLFRNLFLAILSILLSFAGLLQLTDNKKINAAPDIYIVRIIEFIITDSIASIAIVAVMFGAIGLGLELHYRAIMPKGIRLVLRLTQPLPRLVAIFIYLFASIVFAGIAVWLIAM